MAPGHHTSDAEKREDSAGRGPAATAAPPGHFGDDERAELSTDGEEDGLGGGGAGSPEVEKVATRASQRRGVGGVLAQVVSRMTTHSLPEPPPPPDGGVKAWTQVAMGWIVIFTTWGYVNSFGTFQTYYVSTLNLPPSTVSWIGSVQVWLTFFAGAFSGRLLDAGYFLPTFLVGATIQLLGIFLMSVSTRFWHLILTQGALTGLGGGIFFCPTMALIATYFSKRRGLAIGLATTGNATGGLVYPLMVRQLLPRVGFAWTARVLAFVNLGCLALVAAFIRPRLPPRKSGPLVDVTAFREPVYVALVAGLFCVMWGVYYTFYYIASFGKEALGLSYSDSLNLVMIVNGVGIPARLIPPFFADHFGPLNTMAPILCIFFIVAYSWLAVRSIPGLYAFAVIYGIFQGAFQCVLPTAIASVAPRLDMVGTRLGMAFSLLSFAALTGPPIGGALQSAQGGRYTGAQAWAATASMLAFVGVATARVLRVGFKMKRC